MICRPRRKGRRRSGEIFFRHRNFRRAAEALQKQGIVFVKPEDEEIALWRRLADQAIERLIDKGALSRDGVQLVRRQLCNYRNGVRQ